MTAPPPGAAAGPVVVVTPRSFGTGRRDFAAELTAAGVTVVRGPLDHDPGVLSPLLARADGWIAGTAPITAAHLATAHRLRIIARYGVGTDNVDLVAAGRRDVTVTNTPGANTQAVADHALALMLAALRGVVAADTRVRTGDWTVRRSRELRNLTVGIIGFGRIGRAVADRLRGFGCCILATDPMLPTGPVTDIVTIVTPDELVAEADIVSLHAPGRQQIVDDRWLDRLRPGAVLINTARADLIDETAVRAALLDGRLAAYAADTLLTETDHHAESGLLDADLADRVTITPHSAAQTIDAVDLMGAGAVAAVLHLLLDQPADDTLFATVRTPASIPLPA